MERLPPARSLLCLLLCSVLAACGGGSSSGGQSETSDATGSADAGTDAGGQGNGGDDSDSGGDTDDGGDSGGTDDEDARDDGTAGEQGGGDDQGAGEDQEGGTDDSSGQSDGGGDDNIPPEIVLESSVTLDSGQNGELNATQSSDPDGQIETISWEQTRGQPVDLQQADTLNPLFTAPKTQETALLTFQLTLTDDQMDSSTASVEVVIEPVEEEIDIHFPCHGCRFFDSRVTVSGRADTNSDGEVPVYVGSAAGSVQTSVDGAGPWLAKDLSLPPQTRPGVIASLSDVQEHVQLQRRPTLTSALVIYDPVNPGHYYFFEDFSGRERLLRYNGLQDTFHLIAEWSDLPYFGEVVDIALNPSASRLLILDRAGPALLAIDVDDGEIAPLSDNATGDGPPLVEPAGMAVDAPQNRAVVWDSAAESLFAIDLGTGNRTILADNSGRASGPDLAGSALALDSTAGAAYLFNHTAVLRVSLDDGARELLPEDGGRLPGPTSAFYDDRQGQLVTWRDTHDELIAINPVDGTTAVVSWARHSNIEARGARQITHYENQYIINGFSADPAVPDRDAVITVEPGDGARTILVEDAHGTGISLESPVGIVVEEAGERIYSLNGQQERLVRLDLGGNRRRAVSVAIESPRDLVLDSASQRAFVLQSFQVAVVDFDEHEPTPLSGPSRGSGPEFLDATAMTEGPGNTLLVVDTGRAAVIEVDRASGDRSIVSDHSHDGEDFAWATAVDFDADTGTLLVSDSGPDDGSAAKLLSVDVETGERRLLSSTERGTGEAIMSAVDISILPGAEYAVVNDGHQIFRVDLTSGDREIISSSSVGRGESFADIPAVAVQPEKEVLYGWSVDHEALFIIELNSGDRAVVSK